MNSGGNKKNTIIMDEVYENCSERKKTAILVDEEVKKGRKRTLIMEDDDRANTGKKTMLLKEVEEDYEEYNLNKSIYNFGLLNDKYEVSGLLTDDSGEAEIFLAKYEKNDYIIKLYRSRYKRNIELSKNLKELKSPYIIKVIDEGTWNDRFFEVMDYYKNGALHNYKLDRNFIKNVVLKNLIEALKEIHQKGIIHRDIKPSNIFFSNHKDHIILGDFGISSIIDNKVTSKKTSNAKTLEYSAPETIRDIVAKATDYYSVGITIMELLTGKTSYEGLSNDEIYDRKLRNKFNIPLDENDEFYILIKGLTNFSTENRWGYDEVLRWFDGENVPIKDDNTEVRFTRPYKFNGKVLTSRKDLALELSMNWEIGKKNLMRGYLSEYFKRFDQELACRLDDIIERINDEDVPIDSEYFKAIHYIYPKLPLIWWEEEIEDINDLIEKMRKNSLEENKHYCDFVFHGTLEYYLELNKANKESIEVIKSLRELSKGFYRKAYYGLLLLNNSDFYYRGKILNSIENLIDLISKNITEYEKIAQELSNSDYFEMWVKKIGYSEFYDEYIKREE